MENSFFISYEFDKLVNHVSSKKSIGKIEKEGFKTGFELGIAEKRKAIYFSDSGVNEFIYARNKEGEAFEGDEVGQIFVNIKGLKLLNLNYKNEFGEFSNHAEYQKFVTKGELEKIPFEIDGSISFLQDGRIYEVALKKSVANTLV